MSADHQGAPSFRPSLWSGVSRCFHLARKLAAAAALAALLALAPRAAATEVLQNGSFADGTNYWQRSPELAAWILIYLPDWPDWSPVGIGNLILHPTHGFLGPLISQDLNVSNVAGAGLTATITLSKFNGPLGPTNSIAVYADYVDADGLTNRILLMNPADASLPYGISTVTNSITLPASARTLVRYAIARLESGVFESSGVSLDVTPVGGPPELGLSIVDLTDGDTNTAPFALRAGVTNLTATVSSLVFCANGVPIGEGRLDAHGEWIFADGTHLAVMGGGVYEMADYSPPYPSDMFFMNGTFSSQTNFSGMFQYFSQGSMGGGTVSIVYSLDAAGLLTAAMTGEEPLGVRTLTNGTNLSDTIRYGFFWADASAGIYVITARAVYNSGTSVTSAPVNITVKGPVPRPTLQIRHTSPTTIELSWPDDGNVYAVRSQTSLGVGSWNPVDGTVGLIGGRFVQTLSATNQTSFFRLLKLF